MSERDGADILLHWAMAHKVSELLFAAEESGCLAALIEGATLDELARVTGWRRDATSIVLRLLDRLGLLERDGDLHRAVPAAARYLPLLRVERQLSVWHLAHDSLRRALRSGQSIDPLDDIRDPILMRDFAQGMAVTARETALRIRRIVRPQARSVFADLGGADGSVAAELAMPLPEATFRVVDRPAMQAAFDIRMTAANHVGDRARFIPGDLRNLELVSTVVAGADVIMLLNVAHVLPSEALEALLQSIRAAARPGAILIVRELFRVEEGPVGFMDFLLIDWLRCGVLFQDDIAAFTARLCRAGFRAPVARTVPGSPDTFVVATVP